MKALFSLLLLPALLWSQEYQVSMVDSLLIDAERFVGVDSFGSSYYIENNVLFKQQGGDYYEYKNVQLGELTSVDLLNPLEITLFYRDFNTVVQLDNTLNEINKVDFNTTQPFRNVLFARTAIDKSLWIYDENTQQLEVFDWQRQRSTPINQPIQEKVIDMVSNYNFCWVLTEDHLYHFNIYGSLLHTWSNEGFMRLTQDNNKLMAFDQDRLVIFNPKTEQPESVLLPKKPIDELQISGETLYIYSQSSLHTFRWQQPNKED